MVDLHKADEVWEPLSWRPTTDGGANVFCGHGHAIGNLPGPHHQIASDGTVTPSLVSTVCDFHEFVRLVGWVA